MAPLLFSATDPLFEEIASQGLLCAFDFDGTVAPIARDPNRVSVPAPMSRRLAVLRRYATVAIITGRSVNDVTRLIDFSPNYIIGNHGLEGLPGTAHLREICAPICAKWEATLARAINDAGRYDPRIWIENKGHSLCVHYRLVADKAATQEALHRLFGQLDPEPRIIGSKCAFDLLPTTDMNKGIALVRLMEYCGAKHALYVGDDATDEDVFRLRLGNLLTVRVGRSEESSADAYIHHRLDMVHLLDELIKRLDLTELRSA